MTSNSGIEGQIALQTDQGTQSDMGNCDLPAVKDQLATFSCGKFTLRGDLRPVKQRYGWKTRQTGRSPQLQRAHSLGRNLNKSIYSEGFKGNSALPPLRSKGKATNQDEKPSFQPKFSLISPLSAYSRKKTPYSSWCPQENRPLLRLRRRVFLEVSGIGL